jgi:hypothetical protein
MSSDSPILPPSTAEIKAVIECLNRALVLLKQIHDEPDPRSGSFIETVKFAACSIIVHGATYAYWHTYPAYRLVLSIIHLLESTTHGECAKEWTMYYRILLDKAIATIKRWIILEDLDTNTEKRTRINMMFPAITAEEQTNHKAAIAGVMTVIHIISDLPHLLHTATHDGESGRKLLMSKITECRLYAEQASPIKGHYIAGHVFKPAYDVFLRYERACSKDVIDVDRYDGISASSKHLNTRAMIDIMDCLNSLLDIPTVTSC